MEILLNSLKLLLQKKKHPSTLLPLLVIFIHFHMLVTIIIDKSLNYKYLNYTNSITYLSRI